MAYDGLLPPVFARIHPTFKTPFYPTLLSGVICMVAAAFLPLDLLGDITSAGTLFAFALVSLATGILRYTRPELERPFKVPAGYLVSFLGFVCCLGLIIPTGIATILRVVIWLAIGLLVYFGYGHRHSRLRTGEPPPHGAYETLEQAEEAMRLSSSESTRLVQEP
ncbi:cationic amino acid transporter [Blastocladiella britannica]|nr:cationic amino acid transporter [Blastocladiella britannica]